MTATATPPRWLASPVISGLINLCAITFLAANLLQNYALFHERAVDSHAAALATGGDGVGFSPPVDEGGHTGNNNNSNPRLLRGGDRSDGGDDYAGPIANVIPRGKAVALPSVLISEDEDAKISRGQYGGKGDKAHLGGFTEFDVRQNRFFMISVS